MCGTKVLEAEQRSFILFVPFLTELREILGKGFQWDNLD